MKRLSLLMVMFMFFAFMLPPAFGAMGQDGTLYLQDANADRQLGLQDILYQLQILTGVRELKYSSGPEDANDKIVVIAENSTIQGVVTEDTGDAEVWIPIQGALVICESETGEKFTQKTGQNGGFRFESVRPGQHLLAVTQAGYHSSRIKVEVEPDMVSTISVRLKKIENFDGKVTGHVLTPDPSGKLNVLPDAIVSLFPVPDNLAASLTKEIAATDIPVQKTQTDETGAYRLENIPEGRYFVMANKVGFQKVLSIVSVVGGSESKRNLVLFPELSEQTGSLMGKVVENAPHVNTGVWDTFYPVAGAEVKLGYIENGSIEIVMSGTTNAKGGFSFVDVPVGEYTLSVRHEKFEDYRQQVIIQSGGYNPLPVINPNGSLIELEGDAKAGEDSEWAMSDPAKSAYDLLNMIQNVGSGCFCIDPYLNWHQDAQFVKVILKRKQMPEKAVLNGHVFSIDGEDNATAQRKPIQGATIVVTPYFPYPTLTATDEANASPTFAPLPELKTETNEDGFYEFTELPVGYPVNGKLTYIISVFAQGFCSVKEKVDVIPGEIITHNVVLKPEGVIATFGGYVYDGSVKCDDGAKCLAPIENADVVLFPVLSDESFLPETKGEHVKTGPDGKFFFPRLAAIEYQMIVRAPDFIPFKAEIQLKPGNNDEMKIFLNPVEQELKIHGAVLTHTDYCSDGDCEKPVPGAIVYLYSEIFDSSMPPMYEKTVTDENGVFKFFNLGEGNYHLMIHAQGFEKLEDTVTIPPEEAVYLTFNLNPIAEQGSLKGHVFNGAVNCIGANCIMNVPGAKISLFPLFGADPNMMVQPLFVTESDDRGAYRFDHIPMGKYQITATAEMFKPWEGYIGIESGAEQIQDITLLPEGAISSLKGHVFDGNADCASADCMIPIPNASVMLISMINSTWIAPMRTETDDKGLYVFKEVPSGEYQITVRANDYEPFESNIHLPAGDVIEKDLFLKPFMGESVLKGMIRDGSVRCNTNEERCIAPIPGAHIQLYFLTPDSTGTIPSMETISNDEGLYKFSGMPSGEYVMHVKADGYMEWKDHVKIEPVSENVVDALLFPIKPMAKLTGQILDGMVDCDDIADCILPIPKARIELASDPEMTGIPPFFTETDEKGFYEFNDVPSGRYVIHIMAERYQDRSDNLDLQAGENIRNYELMPARQCKENTGCSKSEFCSKPFSECEGEGVCKQRPEGCPEIYAPVCGCDGNTYGNDCEASANGINVLYQGECQPEPETSSLKGMVYDANAKNQTIPEADIYVIQLIPPGTTESSYLTKPFEFSTQSKDDGSYVIERLPVGFYSIIVRAHGYQAWKGEIEILKDEITEKDVFLISYSAEASLKGIVSGFIPECNDTTDCLKPIANALVTLMPLNLTTDITSDGTAAMEIKTTTNANGLYAFENLNSGEYIMRVETDNWMLWEEPVKIQPGKENLIDIELQSQPKQAMLKGIVRNGAVDCDITVSDCIVGIPEALVTLIPQVNDTTAQSLTKKTDDAGGFIFENIQMGFYILRIEAEGFEPHKIEIDIHPGENSVDIELMPMMKCKENSECGDKGFCKKPTGACEDEGICMPRPDACIMLYSPVCGCNGKTYSNECIADSLGINIANDEKCSLFDIP
ncbi:secreted protein containing Proteinase inhibitor I1, Kazal [Candidatus Magnetomorum sp. HK-1]|nr:secreted protein containing Proteinase inhibitor I1, Kazal [Candidatus Magnetomorum sp. HK-1]